MKKIKSEIEGYDVIVLTETRLSKEEEDINKMENTYKNTTYSTYMIRRMLVEEKESPLESRKTE